MLDEGKYPEKILIQFKAIDMGGQKSNYLLLDESDTFEYGATFLLNVSHHFNKND